MKGIVPSLNTPFDINGALDKGSLKRLVQHTVDSNCGGMLGLAVAGEFSSLTFDEKVAFIEVVTDANAGRIPFIVSVTAPKPQASIELAKIAADFNAAGICIQLPDFFSRSENLKFVENLAEIAPGLLMVQDLDWIGDGLAIEDIQFLFKRVDQFSWLKIETKNAGPKYSAVLDATDGALNVCGGWAVIQLMDAMERGVHTFIPTGLERVYVTIMKNFENGDIESASKLFKRLLPVIMYSNQNIETSIRFFKELRKAEGLFDTSVCRTDRGSFSEIDKTANQKALETALTLIRDVVSMSSDCP